MLRRLCLTLTAVLLVLTPAACTIGNPPADGGAAPDGRAAGGAEGEVPDARPAPDDPYAVGVRQLRFERNGRQLPVTLWYPARGKPGSQVRPDRDPADGDFPVVLFSHGLTGQPADYLGLLTRWAAAGFIVAAPTYPNTNRNARRIDFFDVLNQPADATHVLSGVLALDEDSRDPLRGRIDTERVGAAGHSAGGATTIGLFTTRDERLDAGIVLAGTSLGVGVAFSGRSVPMLFVHGQRDNVVAYSAGRAAFEAVPWPKAMLTLPEGDHGRALQNTQDESFKVVVDTTTEFLRWSLYGDAEAKKRIPEDAEAGNVATLDNRL